MQIKPKFAQAQDKQFAFFFFLFFLFFFKFGTREGADFLSKANSYSLGNSDFFAFMFNSGNILLKDN